MPSTGPQVWTPEDAKWAPVFQVIDRATRDPAGVDGLYLVDKFSGSFSGDVVRMIKKVFPARKVGHAGTLDPMASGLLICMLGKATKANRYILDLNKTYSATVRLGETTPSLDADTSVDQKISIGHITPQQVKKCLLTFIGEIVQETPHYSAVKIGGKRLYTSAHSGELAPTLPKRIVSIYSIGNVRVELPEVHFDVTCSTGTYIRSLAAAIGDDLQVGAHLVRLRRTRIGPFPVEAAIPETELQQRLLSVKNRAIDS